MIITENMIPDILKPLPISKIYGLGEKSVRKLNNMGMFKIEDLYELSREFFIEYFGKYGIDIYERIRGIDNREVTVNRDRKSYGRENTLKFNTEDIEDILYYVKNFCLEICEDLKRKNVYIKTITFKYKTSNFENHTRSRSLNYYTNDFTTIYKVAEEIVSDEKFIGAIRLIGITVSSIKEEKVEQLKLF